MEGQRTSAQRWFDRRAGSYESGFTSRWRDPVQRGSLAALELTADDRMLDVGCGTGAASREAAILAKSVVGVDLSPEMLRQAVEFAGGIENVEFRIADFFLRRFEPGHVRMYRSQELGSFLHDAGLSNVRVRKLSDGGMAIFLGFVG